jgi:hypothetical protein
VRVCDVVFEFSYRFHTVRDACCGVSYSIRTALGSALVALSLVVVSFVLLAPFVFSRGWIRTSSGVDSQNFGFSNFQPALNHSQIFSHFGPILHLLGSTMECP